MNEYKYDPYNNSSSDKDKLDSYGNQDPEHYDCRAEVRLSTILGIVSLSLAVIATILTSINGVPWILFNLIMTFPRVQAHRGLEITGTILGIAALLLGLVVLFGAIKNTRIKKIKRLPAIICSAIAIANTPFAIVVGCLLNC